MALVVAAATITTTTTAAATAATAAVVAAMALLLALCLSAIAVIWIVPRKARLLACHYMHHPLRHTCHQRLWL